MTDEYSNDDKWNRWYHGLAETEPQTYGDTVTYELGASWLKDCSTVEDWGCGKGGFEMVSRLRGYDYKIIGIDGSITPFATVKADLAHYRSEPDGIFMRHVIEHDYRWREILDNICASARRRVCLILFTPAQRSDVGTHQIAWNEDPGVPDIGFDLSEIMDFFERRGWTGEYAIYRTATQYGEETVFLLTKESS